MTYLEMQRRHQQEIEALPMGFAFCDAQLEKVIAELGPKDQLVGMGGGCIMRKDEAHLLPELMAKQGQELGKALQDRTFAVEAISYELGNHEYVVTYNHWDALEALGIDEEMLEQSETLQQALRIAKEQATREVFV